MLRAETDVTPAAPAREDAVRISEAAALYGLAPSTLRWWEKQGVLGPPTRQGSRRAYRDHDLRRIGLAYLCCVTGMMSLESTAIATSDEVCTEQRHDAIRAQVARLTRQIDQMQAARDYLDHLLACTSDDPAQCPYLDGELAGYTPRGRSGELDLVAAARAAAAGGLRADDPPGHRQRAYRPRRSG